ncbi:hypothetical protein EJB05_08334, partial [Eragrostis curvula]
MAASKEVMVVLCALMTIILSLGAAVQGCGSTYDCPTPTPPATNIRSCPIDALKLRVCANVLNLLKLNIPGVIGGSDDCCPLLEGLVDLDAAVCLCTAIRANILGINLNVPVDLTLLLNHCGKVCPADFTCPK